MYACRHLRPVAGSVPSGHQQQQLRPFLKQPAPLKAVSRQLHGWPQDAQTLRRVARALKLPGGALAFWLVFNHL